MPLPAFAIPTPSITDPLQYALGSHVGTDVAADVWEVDAGYMLSDTNANGWGALPHLEISGGTFRVATHRTTLGANQWNATQCIIPLDEARGVFPGVRCTAATQSGYFLLNIGQNGWDPQVFQLLLVRLNGNFWTDLAQFNVPGWASNAGPIDGVDCTDGVFCMLEVSGSSPVQLRVSVFAPDGTSYLTTLPGGVPIGTSGQPASMVIGTYSDASSDRILSGRAGLLNNGTNSAGGVYNFNAGEYGGTDLQASAGVLSLTPGLPTLTQANNTQTLTASAGALALTPGMPWLAQARMLSASPASLALSPGLPTLSQHALSLFKAPDGTALPFKVWSGSQWVEVPVRLFNGTSFN